MLEMFADKAQEGLVILDTNFRVLCSIRAACEAAADLLTNNPNGTLEIALLAVGGAITAVDAVMQDRVKNVYALTRPPGHHAEADMGRGFCLFNNVAIAAKYAKEIYGLERILILDWDVHHGNGTQKAFYQDSEVLFISLHQEGDYPHDMGFAEEVGEGSAKG